MITRTKIEQLKLLIEEFPVVGILGPRQCGKTTIAKELLKNHDFIYIDLELPSDQRKLEDAEFFLQANSHKCIIIDEIQLKPELFAILRALVDQNRKPMRFIILGSASPDLIRKTAESLAGRVAYVELTPFNSRELEGLISTEKHHFFGGFPLAALSKNNEAAKRWIESFIATYIERDLPILGISAKPKTIRKLWEMLAWQNGGLINYSTLANSLGVSNHTVTNYIDFLEGAFLVNRLQPYHFNINKRLVKAPKIYLRDTGILHSLLRIEDFNQLLGSHFAGSSWETFCIEQIQSLKKSDIELCYYRTHVGAEIDLVFIKGLKPIAAAEIKFSLSPELSKGFYISIDDLKTQQNFVITPGNDDYINSKGIITCGLITFIEKYLPAF